MLFFNYSIIDIFPCNDLKYQEGHTSLISINILLMRVQGVEYGNIGKPSLCIIFHNGCQNNLFSSLVLSRVIRRHHNCPNTLINGNINSLMGKIQADIFARASYTGENVSLKWVSLSELTDFIQVENVMNQTEYIRLHQLN